MDDLREPVVPARGRKQVEEESGVVFVVRSQPLRNDLDLVYQVEGWGGRPEAHFIFCQFFSPPGCDRCFYCAISEWDEIDEPLTIQAPKAVSNDFEPHLDSSSDV